MPMSKKPTLFNHSRFGLPVLWATLLLFVALGLSGCITGALPNLESTPTLLPTPSPIETNTSEAIAAYPPPAAAYPVPSEPAPTMTEDAYPPALTIQSEIIASPTPADADQTPGAIYFPLIGEGPLPTPTVQPPTPTTPPTATPSPEPTQPLAAIAPGASPTPISLVDFATVRDELAAQGQQLAYNKIGFHVTFLEDREELDSYMERLDAEGVPFFLKSVDNAEPLFKAQELMKASGVPHTLVYRSTKYDVPNYDMDPILAAEAYWELEKAIWPPELDPDLVWFETMNELDKNRSEWLAQFALRTAQLALRDGYRWAAFGWASGEPEPSDWESPAMLELLRLIGENSDRLAIALHEYSYTTDDIGDDYPHKVGRFLELFRVADAHGIPRPTVLITEWGWAYNEIPPEPLAMEDVTWAARLYGAFPEVKGAAIWNLGKLEDTLLPLNTQVRDLIDNMMAFSLDSYFSAPLPPLQTPLDANLFPPSN
jgi:hypothetical protein